jgi:Fe-S-cluster containining protein
VNSSAWVDPADCRACGECCTYYELAYPKTWKPQALSEVDRLRALEEVGDLHTVREDGDAIYLRFPFRCSFLLEEDGVFSCTVYDNPVRPALCAHFPYRDSPPHHCPHKRQTARRPIQGAGP